MFYSGLVLQVLELKPTVLVILLVWFLPILVASVLSAAQQDVGYTQAIIARCRRSRWWCISGILPTAAVAPGEIDEELAVALTGANSGLVFIVLQIAFLWVRWHQQKRADYAACRSVAVARAAAPSARRPAEAAQRSNAHRLRGGSKALRSGGMC